MSDQMNSENRKILDESSITESIVAELDNAVSNEDEQVLQRLAEARRSALDVVSNSEPKPTSIRTWFQSNIYLAGASLASLLVVVVVFSSVIGSSSSDDVSSHSSQLKFAQSDIEWLIESDEVDMLSEELGFYLWVEAES